MSKNLLVLFAAVLLVTTAFASRSKTPDPTLPILDFQIIPSRDTVSRGKSLLVSVVIAKAAVSQQGEAIPLGAA